MSSYDPGMGLYTDASSSYVKYITNQLATDPAGITISGLMRLEVETEVTGTGAIYLTDGYDTHDDEVYILFRVDSGDYRIILGYNEGGSGASSSNLSTIAAGSIVQFEIFFTSAAATSYIKLFDRDGKEIYSVTGIDLTHTPTTLFDEITITAWHTASDYTFF